MRNNILLKIETDPTNVDSEKIKYDEKNSEISFGIDYSINNNFTIGASYERGNYFSLRFIYKNDPKNLLKIMNTKM